jgi:hypothetical protein
LICASTANAAAELAGRGQFAFGIEAKLAGNDQQITGTYESDVVGDRRCRCAEYDSKVRELLFYRSRHFGLHHIPISVAGLLDEG